MNIYARYFDQETVVSSFEELITFLTSIPEINVTTELLDNVKAYIDSPLPYPKRYKLRPRVYFILIKTTAQTIQEFKNNRTKEEDEEVGRHHSLRGARAFAHRYGVGNRHPHRTHGNAYGPRRAPP